MTHDELLSALTDIQIDMGRSETGKAITRLDGLKAMIVRDGSPAPAPSPVITAGTVVRLLVAQVQAPEGAMVTINFPEPKAPQAQPHDEDEEDDE